MINMARGNEVKTMRAHAKSFSPDVKVLFADANGAANLAAWQALVVPPPPTGHIVWTEIQELRVQFRCATSAEMGQFETGS